MKRYLILCISFLTVFISGCSQNSENKNVSEEGNEKNIIWALPQEYEKDTNLGDNIVYLNQKLKEDGYDFTVSLTYISGEGEEYYSQMEDSLKDGRTDIAFLGLDSETDMTNPSQKLIKSGELLSLDTYLKSQEGKELYQAFYEKVWDTVKYKGSVCAIPSQLGRDGNTFVAFNKKYFQENMEFDGSIKKLAEILEKADIPKSITPLLWDVGFSNMYKQMGYEYERGVFLDVKTGQVSCPYESENAIEYFKILHKWNKEQMLFIPSDDEQKKEVVSNMDFAVWVGASWDDLLESVKKNIFLVQLPYSFYTRTSGSTGINKNSDKQEEALQLLTLLYTNSEYGNLFIHGKEGKDYQLDNGYVYTMEDEASFSLIKSMITGIYDNLYSSVGDDFPIDRKKTKWSLYGTSAMKESVLTGFMPDISEFDKEMLELPIVVTEYEELWKEENLDSALAEAVQACNASGSKRVEEELEEQIAEWLEE